MIEDLQSDGPSAADRLLSLARKLQALQAGHPDEAMQGIDPLVLVAERIVESLERELTEPSKPSDRNKTIDRIAAEYGADGVRNSQRAHRLYAGAIGAIAVIGSTVVILTSRGDSSSLWVPKHSVMLAGVAALLLLGVLLLIQAERYRRSSMEDMRLERQLRLVDPYLEPFPARSQVVMRAALTSRVFPRLLEDQDPLKEPVWPPADVLFD